MQRLVGLFADHVPDRADLDELSRLIGDRRLWPRAHELHGRIRQKLLAPSAGGNPVHEALCLFEEACAKTLFNLSNQAAPFDADSPYWVVPSALALARALGLDRGQILSVVDPEGPTRGV